MATNVYSVVGEHRDEPERLLLLGDDGHFYATQEAARQPVEIQLDDTWEVDLDALPISGSDRDEL